MAGVWVFRPDGVVILENPATAREGTAGTTRRNKVLVYTPTNEVITSYASLESKLAGMGWERYHDDPDLLQFHKQSSVYLISLPRDFSRFRSMHMYDIVVKNRNVFEVRDM